MKKTLISLTLFMIFLFILVYSLWATSPEHTSPLVYACSHSQYEGTLVTGHICDKGNQ